MKKAFSVFLSFCLCTITMLGFTACGDDEHEHEDKHEHGRRTDLVDEFGRVRWDDRVNLWAIVCSKPIDFVGNYYVEDMPKAYQQEGLEVRFSGEAYSLEDGKIPPAILTEEFFCLHNYTITPVED